MDFNFLPPQITQPDLWIFGIRIGEAGIMLSGLLVAGTALAAGVKLRKVEGPVSGHFRVFFWLSFLAFLTGAVLGHGFLYCFGLEAKIPGWVLGIASGAALGQAVLHLASPALVRPLSVANLLLAVLIAAVVVLNLRFQLVALHLALVVFLLILPLSVLIFYKKSRLQGGSLLAGISLLMAAGITEALKWSPGIWFHYKDISHFLIAISLAYFFRAAASR